MRDLNRHVPYLIVFVIVVAIGSFVVGRTTAPVPVIASAKAAESVIPPPKDLPKDDGPLHGNSPIFTAVPVVVCPDRHIGSFCDYQLCGNSHPQTTTEHKLWNTTVVGGKDGPVLICEWR